MIGKSGNRALVSLAFALTLMPFQFWGTKAEARSSFFTSRGCVACHIAPTTATCAGCHHHSGKLSASRNKSACYAPGETVTITLTASGALSGWIGARLYDETGEEIARSTGTQSGTGSSANFPAVVSAPAPASPGTFTWRIAYFGNQDGFMSGDVHGDKFVRVPITVAVGADVCKR